MARRKVSSSVAVLPLIVLGVLVAGGVYLSVAGGGTHDSSAPEPKAVVEEPAPVEESLIEGLEAKVAGAERIIAEGSGTPAELALAEQEKQSAERAVEELRQKIEQLLEKDQLADQALEEFKRQFPLNEDGSE